MAFLDVANWIMQTRILRILLEKLISGMHGVLFPP
jgi:hypothetical protein